MASVRKRKSRKNKAVFTVQKSKRLKKKLKKKGKAVSEVTDSFIQALRSTSVNSPKQKCPFSKSEGSFIEDLIKTHGADYVSMARDKRNYNQLTEGELRRKCSLLKL